MTESTDTNVDVRRSRPLPTGGADTGLGGASRGPFRRTSSWLRPVLVVAVCTMAVFATLGSGEESGKGSGGTATTASANGSTPAPPAASTQQSPIPLGTDVEVAVGWKLKVNSAELNGNGAVAAANKFNVPGAGKQFVVVNVTITNASDQPGSPMFEMKVSLLPPSGVAIDTDFVANLPDEIDISAQMQPGASVTGSLTFQVPSDQVNGSVLLGQSQFTMDEAKDQKFFAIQ